MLDLEEGKKYIKDKFDNVDDNTAWLKGWVHGYTSPFHKLSVDPGLVDVLRDELLDYIVKLKNSKETRNHLEIMVQELKIAYSNTEQICFRGHELIDITNAIEYYLKRT